MAITDIAGVLAGIENPLTFMTQIAGTMDAAGTPHSFFNLMRRPNVSAAFTKSWSVSYVYDGNPYNYIYNPSVACPLSIGDNISVVTQYNIVVCGNYTITSFNGDYNAYIDLAYRAAGTANYGLASRLVSSNAPSFTGEVLTSSANQITFVNALSGYKYLAALTVTTGVPGVLLLCDRLWHNGGVPLMNQYNAITSTLTSPSQIPARDINGSNNGVGVLAGNVTLGYTNQSGTTGRSATTIITPTVRPRVGTFYPFGLQAGDTGIQKVTSITMPASWSGGFDPTLTGEAAIVLYRVLAAIDIPMAGVREKMDAVVSGFPRLFDNTVPFLIFIPQTTTSAYLNGSITYTSG
jgi:hypothetical protein